MIKLNEIWIGDEVKIISKGIIGKYEGTGAQKHAFVNVKGKMHLIPASDLEMHSADDEAQVELDLEDEDAIQTRPYKRFEQYLDLHLEKLNPDLKKLDPARILDYQVKAAAYFLEEALFRRVSSVTIIHGKGTGQLKAEVHHLLKSTDGIKHFIETHDGGATEVMF